MKKFLTTIVSCTIILSQICLSVNYNSELQQAYNRAYENSITTQGTIEKANMEWQSSRAELAKMISNYSINILWKTVDLEKNCNFNDVSNELNEKYNYWITNACQLWLMWQNTKNFRPNDWVTRAEFWTVLSRALWWDKNEWWSNYYENHLKTLKSEWIMNKIDTPMNKEIRWYVMLMLMRSINQNANDNNWKNDNQISEVIQLLD